LDGPGPQTVQRLVRTKEGQFVAIGSALSGARQGPAIWTSPDGVSWQASPYLPQGSPTLLGIAQLDDGRLVMCGSVGSADRPAVRCWIQSEQQQWDRWDVEPAGGPAPLYLYGLTNAGGDTLLVGIGRTGNAADAAYWTAELIAK
jgi:molecular chaperone DnaK